MELRWDWLRPLLAAPYVPTLGPVHPKTLGPELFAGVARVAGTGRFLPHDKDRRFLHAQMRQSATGPVLACVQEGRVVGAIGPMEIAPDSLGAARLLPQYFGVLPGYRGLGHGRALWRAAMRWGQQHGAAYQPLQTEVDGASDRLCRAEGLTDLGLVCTSTL